MQILSKNRLKNAKKISDEYSGCPSLLAYRGNSVDLAVFVTSYLMILMNGVFT